ncbi:MAG: hypothetical protein IOC89_05990 [Rhodobacter sp.]|nr:hypothetical protein [Rhodobacter sp.]
MSLILLPHHLDKLALGDAKSLSFGRDCFAYFRENLWMKLKRPRARLAAGFLSGCAVEETPSFSNLVGAPDLVGRRELGPGGEARQPVT